LSLSAIVFVVLLCQECLRDMSAPNLYQIVRVEADDRGFLLLVLVLTDFSGVNFFPLYQAPSPPAGEVEGFISTPVPRFG